MKDKLKLFVKPFNTIKDNKLIFLIWFLFTVFAGQIGIISNFIIRYINGSYSFQETIYLDSNNGSFYTYSIALLAATLGPLFVNMTEKSPTKFKSIKILTIVVSIFTLLFASVFYTSTQSDNIHSGIRNLFFKIDIWQFVFLVISVIISIYAYSVLRLESNYGKYKELDDNFAEEDDENVDNLNNSSHSITVDLKGNKL
jgi:hypothetical protein